VQTNIIYNEDCLEGMKRLPDNSVDLVLTSPPYDNLREYNKSSIWNFEIFQLTAKELARVVKRGGVIVWVVGDATIKGSETGTSFKQALYFKEIGLNLHDTMIYQKNAAPFPGVNRYNNIFEYMFIFSKDKPKTFNPLTKKNKSIPKIHSSSYRQKDGSMRYNKIKTKEKSMKNNIWMYQVGYMKSSKYKDAFQHPAIFPEKLAIDHVKSWSNENDVILDPFMGSGTTAIACLELNRKYIGFELDKEYYKLAQERIDIYNSQLKLPLGGIKCVKK
jgi:DNA modification methylase